MPQHLAITFDVSCRMDEVIANLKLLGYGQSWCNKDIHYTLPHNMLWKQDMAMAQPLQDLKIEIERLNRIPSKDIIVLQKAMTLSCSLMWDGLPNETKTKEQKISELKKQLQELEGTPLNA